MCISPAAGATRPAACSVRRTAPPTVGSLLGAEQRTTMPSMDAIRPAAATVAEAAVIPGGRNPFFPDTIAGEGWYGVHPAGKKILE